KNKPNEISHKKRAPATNDRYGHSLLTCPIDGCFLNEPGDRYFAKDESDPPVQILKLFSEVFITLCKGDLPT
ncbi:uncharacterized protein P174DRAFT_357707, partial [Aspergillus novofumigatus IBT 16806]